MASSYHHHRSINIARPHFVRNGLSCSLTRATPSQHTFAFAASVRIAASTSFVLTSFGTNSRARLREQRNRNTRSFSNALYSHLICIEYDYANTCLTIPGVHPRIGWPLARLFLPPQPRSPPLKTQHPYVIRDATLNFNAHTQAVATQAHGTAQ